MTSTGQAEWAAGRVERMPANGAVRLGLLYVLPLVDLVVCVVVFPLTLTLLVLSVGLIPLPVLALPAFLLLGLLGRGMAGFERHRLRLFLGVPFPPSGPAPRGLRARIRHAPTWRAVCYLLVRWLFAALSFALTYSLGALSLGLLTMPWWLRHTPSRRANLGLLHVTDERTAWLLCAAGVLVGLISVALAYTFGALDAAVGRGLLTPSPTGLDHIGGWVETERQPMRLTAGRAATLVLGLPLALAATAWTAFTGVGLVSQSSQHQTATYPWHGGEIVLTTSAGSIRVTTGDGDRIGVAYTAHYQLRTPTVSSAVTPDGGARLTARCPGWLFDNNCAINYELTVPPGARLTLRTGSGSLHITGHTGPSTADTGVGDITGTDLSGAPITAHTGSGKAALAFAQPPTAVSVTSGQGPITVTLPRGRTPYRVEATSGDAPVTTTVPTDPHASRAITADTGSGRVTVTTPR